MIFPGSLVLALLLLVIASLTWGMAHYAFGRPHQPGAVTFGWLMSSMTVWNIFYALELMAPTLSGKLLITKFEYIGIASIPPLWLAFAIHYTGHSKWLTPIRRTVLVVFPVVIILLAMTNEFHHLIYVEAGLDPQGYPPLVILKYGPWFWINVGVSYIFILGGVVLYLISYFQSHRLFRQQMTVVAVGTIAPLFVNAARLFTPIPLHGFDLTPFTFAISAVFLSVGLFRFNLLNLTPIAAPMVMENMRDAVVVIDEFNRLVNLNSAGRRWLKPAANAIGSDAREALPMLKPIWQNLGEGEAHIQFELVENNQRQWFDLDIAPLRDSKNRMTGRVIVARDVSREQTLLNTERERANQMELLNSITRTSLETATLPEMLQTLADQMGRLLQSDGAFITLWDEAEQRTIPAAAYGELRETYSTITFDPEETTLTKSLLKAGHPLAVDDVFNSPHMSASIAARFPPTRSVLGLPLIANEKKLGAALISFNQPHHFTVEEIAIGEQAAAQIALAVYKAQLYEAERSRVRQMELLNSITRATLEMSTPGEMLQALADQLGELMKSDAVTITLWDELEEKTIPAAAFGELRDIYPKMKFEPGELTLTESSLRAGRPLVVNDPLNSPYMSPSIAGRFPGHSILVLPLITYRQKLGAVMILFNQQHRFTEQEIALGEQAAAQIALALNRADLLETVSRRVVQLGLMQDIGRQMAESLDEKEICQRTVDAMAKAFGYDEAAICMLVDHDELELAAINGAKDMQLMPGFRQKVGAGIIGHVAQTRRQYFASNGNDDPYFFHPSLQTAGAAMGMPMLHEGNLLGVIYIQSTPPHAISPDDAQILQTLASSLVTAIQKARLYAATRDHLNTMTAIQFVSDTVASSLDLKNVLNLIASLLKEKFEYEYTSIYLLKDEVLQIGAQAGYPDHLVICEIPITSGVTGRTIRTRQVQFVRNVNEDESFLRVTHEVTDEICVPLLKEGIPLGVLNVESNSERPLTEKDVELLTALAGPIALAIDNASLHAEVTSLALTDGMTGLMNRRAFDQTLETEIARAARYNQILSLIMLDMDSFKHYNDSYGHPAGDERIKGFAAVLLDNARTPDVAARYGGEEFAIILPHTGKTGAVLLAERIREAAAAQSPNPIAPGTPGSGYTASLGVASFPEDGTTPADLLLAADSAEMTAKRLGRNRVCAAGLAEIPQS